jgi:Zn-dependent membrane protease YugP
MMKFRQTLVPATQISAGASQFLIIIGIVLGAKGLGGIFLSVGAIALAVICLFQLVTLPVEFDASARAKAQLVNLGIVDADEMGGVHETLDAAALTYVAAFVAALGSLLHILLLIAGGSRDD